MQLGTFGAILGFALEMEEQAAQFYEASARGELEQLFRQLMRGSRKRFTRLERARREGVSEMILESITGFDGDAYQVELDPEASKVGRQRQAIALEETTQRYYQDAAEKMPILEIVRLFHRLTKENEQRKAQLTDL
jgi:rubrerythrin